MCDGESSLENEIGDVEAEAMCGGASAATECYGDEKTEWMVMSGNVVQQYSVPVCPNS